MVTSPRTIELQPKPLNAKRDYHERMAVEEDYHTLIDEPVIITTSGHPKVVYLELDEECNDIVNALNTINYRIGRRSAGMRVRAAYVGWHPRITARRDFCAPAATAMDYPNEHALIASYAAKISQFYQKYAPDVYSYHAELSQKVLPEYTIDESVFTSGIINQDNLLQYHYDTGNFEAVWSNMLTFKKDIKGGYLAIPEYDIGIYLRNNSLLMFDGQSILHGVTPFTKLSLKAHRYTIVYYSLQRMWDCVTPGEELTRIRQIRTRREGERAERDRTGEVYDPSTPKKKVSI